MKGPYYDFDEETCIDEGLFQFQCYQYSSSRKHSMPSIHSRPSACSSLAYSLGDTEDLYCDDELHPSLENDPNMRLYTENINAEQQTRDCIDGQRIFDIGDDGKINDKIYNIIKTVIF